MNIPGIEDRGSTGRIAIFRGRRRVGYLAATKAYRTLTGERVGWPVLRAMLNEDRTLAARLIVSAHDHRTPDDGPTVAQWCDTYQRRKRDEGASRATLACYNQTARILAAAWPDRRVSSLAREDGHDLRRRLIEQDATLKAVMKSRRSGGEWSANYVSIILRRAKAILAAAVYDGNLDTNPLDRVTVSTIAPAEPVYVPREAVAELIEAQLASGCKSWAAALVLARFAGARRGELLSAKVEDVHADTRVVFVPNHKNRKRRRRRYIPVSEQAIGYLSRCNTSGRLVKLTVGQVQQIKQALGVDWTWHDLRKSWATDAIRGASSPASYAAAAGHTPEVGAKHYWSARDEDAEGMRV
jgi:integrase